MPCMTCVLHWTAPLAGWHDGTSKRILTRTRSVHASFQSVRSLLNCENSSSVSPARAYSARRSSKPSARCSQRRCVMTSPRRAGLTSMSVTRRLHTTIWLCCNGYPTSTSIGGCMSSPSGPISSTGARTAHPGAGGSGERHPSKTVRSWAICSMIQNTRSRCQSCTDEIELRLTDPLGATATDVVSLLTGMHRHVTYRVLPHVLNVS